MFTLSIFMMAVPTLIMGLLPTYAQIGMWAPILLLLMRVIQGAAIGGEVPGARSEEHTSELPSLMRISYAVCCLKKKTCTEDAQPARDRPFAYAATMREHRHRFGLGGVEPGLCGDKELAPD